ncbi:MAG TPA: endo-1,4-beta-xylanase [Lacipirellulaceae bacterium]
MVLVSWLVLLCGLERPADAQQWLAAANQRIEQHRKANLTITVEDSLGQLVPGADVHVEMKRHSFGFGTAVPASWINNISANGAQFREKLLENFNQVVFENDLKYPPWIGLWGPGFNWNQTQQALDWLDANHLPTRGHYLAWATWSGNDAWGSSQNVSTLPQRILSHISDKLPTVGTRVFEWDVINHPVGWLDDTYENRLEAAGLYAEGLDFYAEIINHARAIINRPVAQGGLGGAHMPLWINEDDIIAGGSRANDYERIIDYLIAHGASPDGIGFQGHFIQEWGRVSSSTPQQVYNRIERFADKGVPLRTTEFDIDVGTDEARQAQLMHDYLTVMFSHPAMEAITMWGFWQGAHWRPNAAIYRTDWSEKPALAAYQNLVFDEWWTDELGVSDQLGELMLRGFKGEYDISVTYDGQEYVLPVVLNDDMSVLVSLPFSIELPGDRNGDGAVNAADYVVWRKENISGRQGYNDWRTNFGRSAALGTGLVTVPEPASVVLILMGGAAMWSSRTRSLVRNEHDRAEIE